MFLNIKSCLNSKLIKVNYIYNKLLYNKIILKLAENNFRKAQYYYAKFLLKKANAVSDILNAARWLDKASNNGLVKASYDLSVIYEQLIDFANQENKDRIIELFKISAENGNSKAQYKLAVCYWIGKYGLKQNNKLAHDWFTLAARNLNPAAFTALGLMYISEEIDQIYNNCNLTKNYDKYKKAYTFFKAAVKLGDNQALCNLAEMSWSNQYLTKDLDYIFRCYKQAAENGYLKAAFQLALCYEKGLGTEKNLNSAFKWLSVAANGEIVPAKLKLADYYFYGYGVKRNPIKAEYLLKSIAMTGHTEAEFKLGSFYDSTKSNLRDYKKAHEWYLKAARKGNTKAQINLASLYLKGEGVPFCEDTAKFWLESAAQNGDQVAEYNLKQLKLVDLDDFIEQNFTNKDKVVH